MKHPKDRSILLSPSMMCADFLRLGEELDTLVAQSVDFLHIDIMDGQYVPNFTLGPGIARSMYDHSGITLDYHLMIERVDRSVDMFCQTPGSVVTFHPETSRHPVRTIATIRDSGCRPGIAIDPAMSLEQVKHLLPLVEVVCLMTVNPGYSGQKLLPFCIDKIAELAAYKREHHPELLIEVDGNVSWDNIPKMTAAGADILVLGTSSVFTTSVSRTEAYDKLHQTLA